MPGWDWWCHQCGGCVGGGVHRQWWMLPSANCHVSEMSGTDSVRHVRHIRCPRPMSEIRHVPFWVRHHYLASVWSQSIQPTPDSSQIHNRHITGSTHPIQQASDHGRHSNSNLIGIGTCSSYYILVHTTIQLPVLWKAAKHGITPRPPPGHPTENTMVISWLTSSNEIVDNTLLVICWAIWLRSPRQVEMARWCAKLSRA